MNFSVYNNLPIGRVFAGIPVQTGHLSTPRSAEDRTALNYTLDNLLNKNVLTDIVRSNPVISSILKTQNLRPELNIENFKRTTYRHSLDTRNYAVGIYNFLPADVKAESNVKYIQKGALLHDIGKVLIPQNILNKHGRLTPKEKDIMHLHSKLSEAILSTQNIEPEVLNIVKYHHQNKAGSGYPEIKNSPFGYDINTEIVSLADKYSALTEKRMYKNPMSSDKALSIIRQDVDSGNINPVVYEALVKFVNSGSKSGVVSNSEHYIQKGNQLEAMATL